jgi:thiamine biosynthesis lipoprotein
MKETKLIMGMPVTVEVIDPIDQKTIDTIDEIFNYFQLIDNKFSTYKENSEISQLNNGKLKSDQFSEQLKEVIKLSEETKKLTSGFFDIKTPSGKIDPSGLVKGWAIFNAAKILFEKNFENFYVEAGGDIQVFGHNSNREPWRVGIKNPFNEQEIVKVAILRHNEGMATSGTYIRGQHIYNPHEKIAPNTDLVSLTVIGPNIYEADRFATAGFAMGNMGIEFIEKLNGFEAYAIYKNKNAAMTSGFEKYA